MNDLVRWTGAAVLLSAGFLGGAAPAGAAWIPCPPGQIPTWDETKCMTPQPVAAVPSGIQSQASYLPEAGPNGAPALRSCNGTPTPFGQPCPGDPQPPAMASTFNQPAITVALPGAGSGAALAATVQPAAAAQPAPVSAAPAVGSAAPAMDVQSLLGDWYTGWMSYLASALNWPDATRTSATAYFATFPACAAGQQSACQLAVWQAILPAYLSLSPGAAVSVTTPAPPPQTTTTAGSSITTPVAAAQPTAAPASVSALLGDWYTGWLNYAAATLGWTADQTAAADASFAAAAPCAAADHDACQAFVMQQLNAWLNPTAGSRGWLSPN